MQNSKGKQNRPRVGMASGRWDTEGGMLVRLSLTSLFLSEYIQLTLDHGYGLCRSTYMWISFQ